MSPYWKFDPYKDLEPETTADVAKVAKEDPNKLAQRIALAGLSKL